jgi:hypothetical protein
MICNSFFRLAGSFAILCCLVACTHQPAAQNDDTIKTIKITDSDLMKESPMHDIIQSIELIPLETSDSCLVSMVTNPLFTTDRIYIKSGGSILVFDRKGQFVNRFNRRGRGPQEYTALSSFFLNDFGGFTVLDGPGQKLLVYDKNDSCVMTQRMTVQSGPMVSIGDNLILCSNPAKQPLFIWDTAKEKVVADLLPLDETRIRLPLHTFWQHAGNTYFFPIRRSDIYTVTAEGISGGWHFDFGARTLTDDPLLPGGQFGYTMPEGSALITNFLESDRYVYIAVQLLASTSSERDRAFAMYYSKENKAIRSFPLRFLLQDVTPEDQFVEIQDAILVIQRIQNWDKRLTDPEDRALLESMKAQMANVKPEDNPVICVYTLQDF